MVPRSLNRERPIDVDPVPDTGRKDLQDLLNLSRAPAIAYLQKQKLRKPHKVRRAPKGAYPDVALFLPHNLFRWAVQYIRYRIGFRHKFCTYEDPSDDGVYPFDSGETRIAVAGDWGSGTDEAHRIGGLISRFKPHYSIHLGDVYFVGDPREVKANFLGEKLSQYEPCRWPSGSKGTFALNGNHEMYARGFGYFDLILPRMGLKKNGRHVGQKASFFCLKNEKWWVIGLDTGYNSIGIPIVENLRRPDCALPDELVSWLREKFDPKKDKRGIVLLSHHQYYSGFDDWYVRPAEQLAEFISRPVLWFWGHEHRLAIYEKYRTGKGIEAYGRCLGHGGMPVELPVPIKHPECKPELVDSRRYKSEEKIAVGVNGFARLTFSAAALKVDYVDVHDAILFTETWTTDDEGSVKRISWSSSLGGP